jgi:hypothetical protein
LKGHGRAQKSTKEHLPEHAKLCPKEHQKHTLGRRDPKSRKLIFKTYVFWCLLGGLRNQIFRDTTAGDKQSTRDHQGPTGLHSPSSLEISRQSPLQGILLTIIVTIGNFPVSGQRCWTSIPDLAHLTLHTLPCTPHLAHLTLHTLPCTLGGSVWRETDKTGMATHQFLNPNGMRN